jgi:hypothetical protein
MAGIGLVFRVALNLFSPGQHMADVFFADPTTKHPFYGVHPED